jgi:hypothetical protein
VDDRHRRDHRAAVRRQRRPADQDQQRLVLDRRGVDDGHVLAGRSNGQVVLFDSRTGAELASAVVATSTPYFVYQAETKLLAVLRDTGTVWVLPLDTGADDPFGDPIAVSDGANNFMLLDPDLADGDALLTIDASMTMRRYSMKTLSNGLSASEIKKAKWGTSTYAWGYNRRGESYTLNGGTVDLNDGKNTVTVKLPSASASGVYVSPSGAQLAVVTNPGVGSAVTVVDRKGASRWSLASRTSLYWAVWSEDESRAIVLGQGGAMVVDAKTGDTVATALAWAFGLSNELPQSFPPGLDPGF